MTDDNIEDPPATTGGSVIAGRYHLIERIGRGGMADVFRAEDEVLHRRVAVKIFRFDAAAGEAVHRIDAEMRLLASLRHPGLVTVFDAGTAGSFADGDAPFLVMDLIDGPTLSQLLTGGALETSETALIGAELATTLRYVHATGIVHRDVKPANILLESPADGGPGRSAKLTDFGIARVLDSTSLTMTGTTVGTANYLSPEQAQGHAIGPASDIYSLGLVLIECLTGQMAYPGHGVEAALARLHRLPAIPHHLAGPWSELLPRMTDRDPQARPDAATVAAVLGGASRQTVTANAAGAVSVQAAPTAATVVLAKATSSLPITTLPEASAGPVGAWMRRTGSSRRAGYAIAALVAVLAAVLAVVALSAPTASVPPAGPADVPQYPSVPGLLGRELKRLEGTLR